MNTVALQCGHCGSPTDARYIGHVWDAEEDEFGAPAGEDYQLFECQNCRKVSVRSAFYRDGDEPDDANWSEWLPSKGHFAAAQLFAQAQADRASMEIAIQEAQKCVSEPGKNSPLVGAVIARNGKPFERAHRGEIEAGEHAEFTLLRKLENEDLSDATLYVTLEPCTSRGPDKYPCVRRVLIRKIPRVVVGMLDPNEKIRGLGIIALRDAGVRVELFPHDLMIRLESLNHRFILEQSQNQRKATKDEADG